MGICLVPPHSGVEGGIGVKGDWERAQTLIRLSMESLGMIVSEAFVRMVCGWMREVFEGVVRMCVRILCSFTAHAFVWD